MVGKTEYLLLPYFLQLQFINYLVIWPTIITHINLFYLTQMKIIVYFNSMAPAGGIERVISRHIAF
jgi:hypothetical protein